MFLQLGTDHAHLAGNIGAAGADLMLTGHHVELEPGVAAVHNALGAQDHAVSALVQRVQGLVQILTAVFVGRLLAPAREHLVGVVVVMLVIGFIKPRATPFTFKDAFAVDMKPWRNVKIASIGILFAMIGVYAGLAEFGGYGTRWLAMISNVIAAVVIVYLIFDSWRHRHDPAVTFTPDAKDSL